MSRNNTKSSTSCSDEQLPHLVTIVGRGVPGNFELTVDGEIEPEAENPREKGLVVSETAVEGSIEVGTEQFRFSGEMANLRIVDWNGIEASESACAPTAHVEYGVGN